MNIETIGSFLIIVITMVLFYFLVRLVLAIFGYEAIIYKMVEYCGIIRNNIDNLGNNFYFLGASMMPNEMKTQLYIALHVVDETHHGMNTANALHMVIDADTTFHEDPEYYYIEKKKFFPWERFILINRIAKRIIEIYQDRPGYGNSPFSTLHSFYVNEHLIDQQRSNNLS